jgi:hypothetical protein
VEVVTEAEGDFMAAGEEDSTAAAQEGFTAAEATLATAAVVVTTAVITADPTMVGGEATTVGVAGIGATLVMVVTAMVTDGDLALASAGGGHTGIRTATGTALGGDIRILITIRIAFPGIPALITGTMILPRQILARDPRTIRRILRDLPW